MPEVLQQARCYWVSDLHLFSRRSVAHQLDECIAETARDADLMILGGDIFDFSWSTKGSVDKSVEAAAQWLRQLAAAAPDCQFHFLVGNHDNHQRFIDRLQILQLEIPNLEWHPYFLRIGNSLFLHGDAADAGANARKLALRRSRWLNAAPKRLFWHYLYDFAITVRLHRMTSSLMYRERWVVRRLLRYLEEVGHGRLTGLRHVYFGHTHVPMSHYEYQGIRFHNGGAAIKGLECRILEPVVGGR